MRKTAVFLLLILLLTGCTHSGETVEAVVTPPVFAQDWTAMLSACACGVGRSGSWDTADPTFAACFMAELEKQGISGEYGQFVQSSLQPAAEITYTGVRYAFRTDTPKIDNGDGTYTQTGVLISLSTTAIEEGDTYAVTAMAAAEKPLGLLLLRIEKIPSGA